MKKLLCLALALMMLLGLSSIAFAADMGVQVIGGPEAETESVNLDDLKMNEEAVIDGWGNLTITSCSFEDILKKYDKGGWSDGYYSSGTEADYLLIRMDITNTTVKSKNFLSNVEVKVIYDQDYEYAGWFYQYDYNKDNNRVIHSDNIFSIDPMYAGHYVFGCALPNAIVNSKKPLQMIITIGGNEITYNVRK